MTKLRYVENWAVVRLADGTPVVVTNADRRGARMVNVGRGRGRWVGKDEEVEVMRHVAELAHLFLESLEPT